MNVEMDSALTNAGVAHEYELHPGLHSRPYRDPYLRSELEAHLAAMRSATTPTVFDYRSISAAFSVWGWGFRSQRDGVGFLNLRDVSCSGLTLQGSGVVTVHVPRSCHVVEGKKVPLTVDLGPPPPTDEPLGASGSSAYGKTVRVTLTRAKRH
jgi:hypothetical protein